MKRYAAMLCAILLLLLSAGCAVSRETEETGFVVWFAGDTSQWSASAAALGSRPYEGSLTVEGLMSALLAGPDRESGLLSPIPAGTVLLGWELGEDGGLSLDLSEEYAALEGVELTLADYCITMTMEQLDGVKSVCVTAGGQPVAGRYRQSLNSGQVLLSGAEEQPVEVSALLYFPRAGGRGLGVENRKFQMTEDDVLVEVVTRALLEGPRSGQLASLIPEGTQLRSVELEDGVCRIDLSAAMLEQMPQDEDSQTLIIYSLVDTLGNLDSVESVVIQVEGQTLGGYGSVVFDGGLEPDFGLAGDH